MLFTYIIATNDRCGQRYASPLTATLKAEGEGSLWEEGSLMGGGGGGGDADNPGPPAWSSHCYSWE